MTVILAVSCPYDYVGNVVDDSVTDPAHCANANASNSCVECQDTLRQCNFTPNPWTLRPHPWWETCRMLSVGHSTFQRRLSRIESDLRGHAPAWRGRLSTTMCGYSQWNDQASLKSTPILWCSLTMNAFFPEFIEGLQALYFKESTSIKF